MSANNPEIRPRKSFFDDLSSNTDGETDLYENKDGDYGFVATYVSQQTDEASGSSTSKKIFSLNCLVQWVKNLDGCYCG